MSKVEVVSSTLVGISSVDGNWMSRLDLAPWDLQLLLANPIQRGILFHTPTQSHPNFIHHLKISLSRTLHFFSPLAGRLATVQNEDHTVSFFIDCNNAGAEFVHAVAKSVSVLDILEPRCVPEELVSSFFRLNGVSNLCGTSTPLLGVQVTELVDGVFISCAANHAVVDGVSFWHFFNSWSEISRGFHTISKPPVFQRWFPSDGDRLIRLPPPDRTLPTKHVIVNPPPLMRRVFHFSKESLAKLKAKANSESNTNKITSLQALSAHLWRGHTRYRTIHEYPTKKVVNFTMAIGARGRIPLAKGYFGNAVYAARTAINEEELLQRGLGFAAEKINELIGLQTKERAVEFIQDWVKNPGYLVGGSFSFFITSSPHHDVYGNDFGWGKPIGVRCGKASFVDGNMSTFPAMDGGIEVHACIPMEVLQAMEQDTEFMQPFLI